MVGIIKYLYTRINSIPQVKEIPLFCHRNLLSSRDHAISLLVNSVACYKTCINKSTSHDAHLILFALNCVCRQINDPKKMASKYSNTYVFITDMLAIFPSETVGFLLSGKQNTSLIVRVNYAVHVFSNNRWNSTN
jgi:hypothetical protein